MAQATLQKSEWGDLSGTQQRQGTLLPSVMALPFSPVPRSQRLSPEQDAPTERDWLGAPEDLLPL